MGRSDQNDNPAPRRSGRPADPADALRQPLPAPDFTESILAEVSQRRAFLDRRQRRLVWTARVGLAAAVVLAVGCVYWAARVAPPEHTVVAAAGPSDRPAADAPIASLVSSVSEDASTARESFRGSGRWIDAERLAAAVVDAPPAPAPAPVAGPQADPFGRPLSAEPPAVLIDTEPVRAAVVADRGIVRVRASLGFLEDAPEPGRVADNPARAPFARPSRALSPEQRTIADAVVLADQIETLLAGGEFPLSGSDRAAAPDPGLFRPGADAPRAFILGPGGDPAPR